VGIYLKRLEMCVEGGDKHKVRKSGIYAPIKLSDNIGMVDLESGRCVSKEHHLPVEQNRAEARPTGNLKL
jgi:hypothetical protein